MIKRLIRLGLALVLLIGLSTIGLSLKAAPAQAYHRWVNYHWARTSNPVTLTYNANVSSTWSGLVSKVIGEWDNVSQYKAGTFDVFNLVSVGSGAKIKIESKNYGATGWFGEASITVNLLTGHIDQGTVQVNDYYFTGGFNTTAARDHVLCQEVGHVWGLEHNELPALFGASCMDDDNGTLNDPAFQTPNYHDAEQLNSIYRHLDTGVGTVIGAIPVTEVIDIIPAN